MLSDSAQRKLNSRIIQIDDITLSFGHSSVSLMCPSHKLQPYGNLYIVRIIIFLIIIFMAYLANSQASTQTLSIIILL